MSSQLISNLRTRDDLLMLKEEIAQLKNALYQKDKKYEEVLNNNTRKWVSEIISNESKGSDVSSYLKAAEEELKKAEVVSAAISQEPSDVLIGAISSWIKKNVSPFAVTELFYNPQLIGGIIISYRGKYLDLSLRKKIAGEMENLHFK